MVGQTIQAVIFDAAGTLIRLAEPVGDTYARVAKAHGVDVPAARLDEAFARVFAGAPANVHPGEPLWRAEGLERGWWFDRVRETFRAADQMVHFDDFDAFFDAVWTHFGSADAWQPAPGTQHALDALAERRIALGIVSNFDQRLRPLLAALDLHEPFDAITTPAEAGAAKPERRIFDVCLKRLGKGAHRALYVGDDPEEDVAGARAAGLHALDVTTLGSLAELPSALDALEKELA